MIGPALETERLILRAPEDRDRAPLAALHGDHRVGDWLGGTLTREQSDAALDRIGEHFDQHGFGPWTVALKDAGVVIGLVGLMTVNAELPVGPGVEIEWRLAAESWGQGYAGEAARAALDWGFGTLALPEIVAFTAQSNLRSQAVMRKIGMVAEPWRDFDHPKLADGHPLRPHVVFAARR